jgi:aldose 1-epimerase
MQKIKSYQLKNKQGMQVTLLDLGARVSSIKLPIDDVLTELTLGYEKIEDYHRDQFYMGATVGRVCNRIAKGQFVINDDQWQVSQNSGEHCLHGGEIGFSGKHWQLDLTTLSSNSITFTLVSPDKDQGFPGEVLAKVCYHLADDNCLLIDFFAETNKTTPVNFCNHCYFHLGEQSINDLYLQLNADSYLPTNESGIPTGEIKQVKNSDFCFHHSSSIGARIDQATDKQIAQAHKGFDHCYVLKQKFDGGNVTEAFINKPPVATLQAKNSGVTLEIFTDQLGMQLYSTQYLQGQFTSYQAICLEAQGFPNAVNMIEFESGLLTPKRAYHKRVVYRFSTQIN